jgi:hypothetical protein
MSATIHKLPGPTYHPDASAAFRIIDKHPGDHAYLFDLARLGVGLVDDFQKSGGPEDDVTPAECQKITNALFLAWAALGVSLGIPRELMVDDDVPGGAA